MFDRIFPSLNISLIYQGNFVDIPSIKRIYFILQQPGSQIIVTNSSKTEIRWDTLYMLSPWPVLLSPLFCLARVTSPVFWL